MKRFCFIAVLVLSFSVFGSAVMAAPPMVEYFFVKYDGVDGLKRAEAAIQSAGFKLINGTYQGEDRVGVLGNYTAAIGCSTEYPTAVVFVVAGPDYKEAHKYARQMQDYFIKSGKKE